MMSFLEGSSNALAIRVVIFSVISHGFIMVC